MPMQLEIVTPEKKVFSDQVDSVVVPGVEGEMEILPQHEATVTTLMPGSLIYRKGGQSEELAVGEGLVEITLDGVNILTDLAMADAEIDEKLVEEALARAETALKEKTTDEDVAAVQAAIQKSMAQLNLKRKRRRV
ncbi:MAG: ATP synthase F1 subunit epsilon [Verrucomicrobiota bacterium]